MLPSFFLGSIAIVTATYSPKSPPSLIDKIVLTGVSSIHPPSKDFINGSIDYESSLIRSLYNWSKTIANVNPKIVLDIPLKNYNQLLITRDKALNSGFLIDKGKWLKSDLRTSYSSQSIPIRLRLKGDYTDHFQNDKWSFKIKTRKDTYYDGMKVFSVQPALTRSYAYE